MIRSRFDVLNGSGITMRPQPGVRALCGDNTFNLILGMDRSSTRLDSNGRCGSLNGWHKGFKRHDRRRVEQERHAFGTRCDFLQQLGPLTSRCRIDCREAGDVGAWVREVRGKAAADRIGYYCEHDR